MRRFWRGDRGAAGAFATRICGSARSFSGDDAAVGDEFRRRARRVPLRDLVSYSHKQNWNNGEENRDGNSGEIAWNNGSEGETRDEATTARRESRRTRIAGHAVLSRGTLMLTAGDEFGRTQNGNNNCYAQDNALTWLGWEGRPLPVGFRRGPDAVEGARAGAARRPLPVGPR